MMRRMILAIAGMIVLGASPAAAQLYIDPAAHSIDITTGFDGAQLVVYGTRKGAGDIAVVLRGPDRSVVVRRKARVLGLWMNGRSVAFDDVPGYYDLALSRPAAEIAPLPVLRRHNIGLDALDFATDDSGDVETISAFREALIRNRQSAGLYPLEPDALAFIDEGFFKVSFALPSNVPAGIYRVEGFLLRGGEVVDSRATTVKVAQNGFSADIFLFAHGNPLGYALATIMIAVFFGWGGHILLRRE